MRLLLIVMIFAVVVSAAPAAALDPHQAGEFMASSLDTIDSADVSAWSLHFGIYRYPGLNPLQKAKERIRDLQADIEKHERLIAEKRAELERLLADSAEHRESSLFLLGLYGRNTCVKDFALVYDEKSLLWGAIKWGKRRP
jgi:hypothetical protein